MAEGKTKGLTSAPQKEQQQQALMARKVE